MRLSTDVDEATALATIAAAVEIGITLYDTARAYGDNEALVARALRGIADVRIVTKGGMARPDGRWVPDGRAKTLLTDCEASIAALDGRPIDLWLLHAPDPRTPWRTSLRALRRLVDEGLVRRVGVCNVNRDQLDEALDNAPISAVQCALSVVDDRALRGGVVERCEQNGLTFIAHSPLGGPRKAHKIDDPQAALGWLLALSQCIVPIPGARRPETARALAEVPIVETAPPKRPPARRTTTREVVVIMGIPGAGKTSHTERYVEQGFVRLNRDERGGTLRDLHAAFRNELSSSDRSIVLDNTYLSRAARSFVLEAAVPARCVWIDTPLAQAQINMVERLLELNGSLPRPDEVKALAKLHAGIHTPTTQMRSARELEPPTLDEGWSAIERLAFTRRTANAGAAVFVAAAAASAVAPSELPHLVFDWNESGSDGSLTRALRLVRERASGIVEGALCPHGGGPPRCWCRPPLPGLVLDFARRHGVDPARSTLIGASPAHRTLANALGAAYIDGP